MLEPDFDSESVQAMEPVQSSSSLDPIDLRPSINGQSKRKKRSIAPTESSNSVQAKMARTLESISSSMQAAVQTRSADDEFEMFGKFIVSELRSMEKEPARALKRKLLKVMLAQMDAEIPTNVDDDQF